MIAGLVRALVRTCAEEESEDRPVSDIRPEILGAAAWRAGRSGLTGDRPRRANPPRYSTTAVATGTIGPVTATDETLRDRRLLLLSVWVSTGFAVLSSVWGLLSGSAMIVLDGLYSFVSVGLSTLAVLALRMARSGPSESYPWGREATIDPAMVVAVSALFLVVPVRLVVAGARELLSMAAPRELREQLQTCVDAVGHRFPVDDSVVGAAKVGARLDVEVSYVVGGSSAVRTVADCDQVRQELHDRFAALGHQGSVLVALTTDRKWVT